MVQAEGSQQQVQAIELDKATAVQHVKDRDLLLGLLKNRAFKRIFTEMYFKEEPVRLVMMKNDPRFKEETVDKQMYGMSTLQGFLREVLAQGDAASGALREFDQALDELREEDLD